MLTTTTTTTTTTTMMMMMMMMSSFEERLGRVVEDTLQSRSSTCSSGHSFY